MPSPVEVQSLFRAFFREGARQLCTRANLRRRSRLGAAGGRPSVRRLLAARKHSNYNIRAYVRRSVSREFKKNGETPPGRRDRLCWRFSRVCWLVMAMAATGRIDSRPTASAARKLCFSLPCSWGDGPGEGAAALRLWQGPARACPAQRPGPGPLRPTAALNPRGSGARCLRRPLSYACARPPPLLPRRAGMSSTDACLP